MSSAVLQLGDRIRNELEDLVRLVNRVEKGWDSAQRSGDDLYIDSVALNLHGIYDGLESLFEKIAVLIDGALPEGTNWHELLLKEMSRELSGTRPAVLSESCRVALDEYRGFRHVVRHVYTYKFDPKKIQGLVDRLPRTFEDVRRELQAFADFVEQAAQDEPVAE